jgi:hypothetical protein
LNRHLSDIETVDFVRGVATRAARRSAEQHLESGCTKCTRVVALYRRIAETAREDARWDPPAAVLERAAEILIVPQHRVVALKRPLVARLVFDSFRQPLPAGVRAGRTMSRHVLYRAGDFFVDLRMDAEHGARRGTIVGQIARRRSRRPGPSEPVTVLLLNAHTVLARPAVNDFGEFRCDYDLRAPLRLRILLGGQKGLDLPLTRLLKSFSGREIRRRES